MERNSLDYVLNYVESMPTQIGRTTAFRFFILLSLQVNGTQLAAAGCCHDVYELSCHHAIIIVWSYPSGQILFQKKKEHLFDTIKWNSFRQDIFATINSVRIHNEISFLYLNHDIKGFPLFIGKNLKCQMSKGGKLFSQFIFNQTINFLFFSSLFLFQNFQRASNQLSLWNTQATSRDVSKTNQFHTLESDGPISRVEWISANRIAVGLVSTDENGGLIKIWQIDEEKTTNSQIIKQFKHSQVSLI